MIRLGGMDASFLYMETPETPMHVAGFTTYELDANFQGSFYEHFRAFLESRLPLIPIFRKKLAPTPFGLHHPGWVDDPDIDLDYHIKGVRLEAPGSWAQAEAMVARLHAERLDRNRPLWQFVTIEGFSDGKVALYSKVHHAAIDGGAGMVVTRALYDVTPGPRNTPVPPPAPLDPPTLPDLAGGLADLLVGAARQQSAALRALPQVMGALAEAFAPPIARDAKIRDILPKFDLDDLPQMAAPRTPFNVAIGAERAYAARSASLGRAKRAARAAGATLNDFVMAACGGALRRYLAEHRALPARSLLAAAPVSLRPPGNTDMTNQVSMMICSLATDVADPVERLAAVRKSSSQAKSFLSKIKDVVPQDFAFPGAPTILTGMAGLFGRMKTADYLPPVVNVLISNVPGPPVPLYCAGARVVGLYPVSIPAHGGAVNITVQSYVDSLDFGVTAASSAAPDADWLADLIVEAMDELADALLSPAREGARAGAPAPQNAAPPAHPAPA